MEEKIPNTYKLTFSPKWHWGYKGALADVPPEIQRCYPETMKQRVTRVASAGDVRFSLVGHHTAEHMKLIWTSPRREWIATSHHSKNLYSKDIHEWYGEVYKPDSYCLKRILEAHRIPLAVMDSINNTVKGKEIWKMPPYELYAIGDTYQGNLYSLTFNIPDDEETWAVDWSRDKRKWSLSSKEYSGCFFRWWYYGTLDEEQGQKKGISYGYKTLLTQFGLREEKYPLEVLVSMSPRSLAEISLCDPYSDTLGDFRRASEVMYMPKKSKT